VSERAVERVRDGRKKNRVRAQANNARKDGGRLGGGGGGVAAAEVVEVVEGVEGVEGVEVALGGLRRPRRS
jgi:hypothetical protein